MHDRTMYQRAAFVRRKVSKQCALCDSKNATIALQVLCRSVGKGQGQQTRVMKLSQTIKVCEGCGKRKAAILGALATATAATVEHVQTERTVYGLRARR